MLYSRRDIVDMLLQWSVLPFFKGEVEGFSIEENITPDLWFPDDGEGVWEWKSDIMVEAGCVYGKFYLGKACFMTMDIFAHLMNYRRCKYLLTSNQEGILDVIIRHESILSRELKKECGYTSRRPSAKKDTPLVEERGQASGGKDKRRSFDSEMIALQMSTHVLTADFEWNYNRRGERYGWSIARYCTPEAYLGEELIMPDCSVKESRQWLLDTLMQRLPFASEKQIIRLIEGK